ncbi:MAG: hydantoinase B/oxoprolinase family protein [Alphaproteobacteria bacterium]|nr:hydantoinase B/oxoprolinase family protein [Alphaproteobacteria bacterium]
MSANASDIGLIHKQIVWNRLIAAVEEQAQTLIRTAFSPTVSEAGDLAAGVFDRQGHMLAQAVTGTPGHVNSMANGVQFFLKKFPIDSMREGDHYITNDPWLTSGHLHDITVVTPFFHRGRAVGLIANTCHVVDIGGRGFGPDGRSVFEEGLFIPVMKLARAGQLNDDLFEIIRENVRDPQSVEGDIFSFMAANEEGARRALALMHEFDLPDLEGIGQYIIEASREATKKEIARLPNGVFRNNLVTDGYDKPVELMATLTIKDGTIHVDYTGTTPASPFGINVVLNYTQAYTLFGLKCIIAPEIPNNYGSLAPFSFHAPESCILNAKRPAPVSARHVIGHMLPDLIFGCLHQAMPGRVPAEGSSANWQPQFRGGRSAIDTRQLETLGNHDLVDFDYITFHAGGTGGRPTADGMSATAFPSGVKNTPVEVSENRAPLVFWRKELRAGSGGAGQWRGGLGQVMEVGGRDNIPFAVLAMFDRVSVPPKGRERGAAGAPGRVRLGSGPLLRPKGQQTIPAGDRLTLEMPGGGGFGDPLRREPALVALDVANGLISAEAAAGDYGVAIGPDGQAEQAASEALRASRRASRQAAE